MQFQMDHTKSEKQSEASPEGPLGTTAAKDDVQSKPDDLDEARSFEADGGNVEEEDISSESSYETDSDDENDERLLTLFVQKSRLFAFRRTFEEREIQLRG